MAASSYLSRFSSNSEFCLLRHKREVPVRTAQCRMIEVKQAYRKQTDYPIVTPSGHKPCRNPAPQQAPDLILPIRYSVTDSWLAAAYAIQPTEAPRVHVAPRGRIGRLEMQPCGRTTTTLGGKSSCNEYGRCSENRIHKEFTRSGAKGPLARVRARGRGGGGAGGRVGRSRYASGAFVRFQRPPEAA